MQAAKDEQGPAAVRQRSAVIAGKARAAISLIIAAPDGVAGPDAPAQSQPAPGPFSALATSSRDW